MKVNLEINLPDGDICGFCKFKKIDRTAATITCILFNEDIVTGLRTTTCKYVTERQRRKLNENCS